MSTVHLEPEQVPALLKAGYTGRTFKAVVTDRGRHSAGATGPNVDHDRRADRARGDRGTQSELWRHQKLSIYASRAVYWDHARAMGVRQDGPNGSRPT